MVVDYARNFGLRHSVNPVPALAIGACEATPMEMTTAYMTFARGGTRVEPYCVDSIYDRNGRLLEKHEVGEHEVLSPQTAYVMTTMLQDVVLRGTGAKIPGMGFRRFAGGKTGTTNDYSDAWFVGFTPQVACGVWVGVDERRSLGRGVTGSDGAIPIWVPAMLALHRDLPLERFSRPEGVYTVEVCNETNKVATKYCPNRRLEYIIQEGSIDTCDVHRLGRPKRDESLHHFFGGKATRRQTRDTTRARRPLMF
jgi:penicillin-binding protein 1A